MGGQDTADWKNVALAVVLSLLVFVAYDKIYYGPKVEKARQQALEQAEAQKAVAASSDIDGLAAQAAPATVGDVDGLAATAPAVQAAPAAGAVKLLEGARVTFENQELAGSILLTGAHIDDVILKKHKVELNGDENVRLLSKATEAGAYYTRYGWMIAGKPADFVPGQTAIWTADRDTVSPGSPVRLTWDNGYGVTFVQDIALDDQFLFTVTQSVINKTAEPLNVQTYGLILRGGQVKTEQIFVLHEGPFGVFTDELVEETYDSLREDGIKSAENLTGGWFGITDKYWMATLIPDQKKAIQQASLRVKGAGDAQKTRVLYQSAPEVVAPGATLSTTEYFYAGAKEVRAIDQYQDSLGISLFDLSIDWGWFYFLTRPIFFLLTIIYGFVGNFGFAIILLTILVKAALYPLANKSYVSMAHMKKAAPKIKSLQERYKDDKPKMQQEMMALYQKEKINPLAGCLPMLLQIPVFFALYKVLYVAIDMRHQPFVGWINDLSAPDPLSPFELFGLFQMPDALSFLAVGVWPILMGLTMWLQQKANPQQNMEPMQQKIMMMLPIVFTFILGQFAAGLVIYWTLNSALSVAQQVYITKREEARETAAEEARKIAKMKKTEK